MRKDVFGQVQNPEPISAGQRSSELPADVSVMGAVPLSKRCGSTITAGAHRGQRRVRVTSEYSRA